jgi:hypothetical protein
MKEGREKGTFLISAKHPSGRLGREMRNVPFFRRRFLPGGGNP